MEDESLSDLRISTARALNELQVELDPEGNISDFMRNIRLHCHRQDIAEVARQTLVLWLHANNSFYETAYTSQYSLPSIAKTFLSFVFVVVGCVGLVGNLLTVLVIYKTTSLHSHTNYFLASLACSDFFLIVVGVPFDLFHIWRNGEPLPIAGTTISLFTFASILTIVSLTLERFQAICHPFSHRTLFDRRRVMTLIYGIWIVAALPSIYIGIMFKRVVPDFCGYNRDVGLAVGSCDLETGPNSPFRYPFELAMIVTFVLPLIFIIYCYFRILATLNEMSAQTMVHTPVGTTNSDSSQVNARSSSQMQHFPLTVHTRSYQPPRSQQAQKMVIKMLVTVTAVFFICYLPYHLQRLIVQYTKQHCESSIFCLLLYPITGLLQYVSATLNPIFYNLMSVRFRNAFNKLIKDFISKSDKEYSTLARL